MKKTLRIYLLLAVLVMAALACGLPGSTTDTGDATEDASILFQDDFSSTSSGWEDLYRGSSGMTDYDQGGFRIQVLQPNFDYWANPGLNFTDTIVEVDAKKIGGPEDNDFGVICRYVNSSNFYFMIVASDGYYAIGKYTGGTQSLIGSDTMSTTDKVLAGDATNKLRGECVGSTLRLSVNGSLLTEVTDSDHTSGDVGLMAGTFDDTGTDILFDNFVVRRP